MEDAEVMVAGESVGSWRQAEPPTNTGKIQNGSRTPLSYSLSLDPVTGNRDELEITMQGCWFRGIWSVLAFALGC